MFLWGGLGGGGSLPQSPPLVAALPPPENVGAYGDRELSSPLSPGGRARRGGVVNDSTTLGYMKFLSLGL